MKIKVKIKGVDLIAVLALLISAVSLYFSFFYAKSALRILIRDTQVDGVITLGEDENYIGEQLLLNTDLSILLINDGNRPVTVLEMFLTSSNNSLCDGGNSYSFKKKPIVIPPVETVNLRLCAEGYAFLENKSVFKTEEYGDKVAYLCFDIVAIDYTGRLFNSTFPLGQYYIEINIGDTLVHSMTQTNINVSVINFKPPTSPSSENPDKAAQ
ncbi:hypothetical protein LVD17_28160 [Fulvivirga ulvae]|uniref:hypothetical protein n=1 Tax=Fulvivirga ulvae TaxID=2904245 RepID=UPI001F29387B|nr:hypothetical protein [Fulvivirga ulvae]UII32163.1 hypothetical protein LVD17_28160 [Fulvivirga ulvae]